jgi:hypothetical protein
MRVGAQCTTTGRWEPIGAVGVATTGGAPRGLPRDQACEPDGDQAFALPGRKAYPGGVASAHSGRSAGECGCYGTERGKRKAALRLANAGVRVLGRMGTRTRHVVRACALRCQDRHQRSEQWRRRGDRLTNRKKGMDG